MGWICRVQIDGRANISLAVDNLKRATTEHRSIDAGPDPDALRTDVNPGLGQQKHQERKIENGEGDKKSLTLHDLSS
jgi:hypothetical protein